MAIFDLCPRSWPFVNISPSQKVLILSSPITIQSGHVLLDLSAKCPDYKHSICVQSLYSRTSKNPRHGVVDKLLDAISSQRTLPIFDVAHHTANRMQLTACDCFLAYGQKPDSRTGDNEAGWSTCKTNTIPTTGPP
jgi:hypothetical protein